MPVTTMRDVTEALDAVDLVVSRAEGYVEPSALEGFRYRAKSLRNRRGYSGDSLVVAIAGGTGSGKSSLLNALAGERVASVSPLRPHTDKPLAWVPKGASAGLHKLLDDLGIPDRVTQDLFPKVALVDLPDMDSVALWHRALVENLLPNVDAVIWVLDPEKYRDRELHEEFLEPLSRHRDQFMFVLNKIDLVRGEDDRTMVASHALGVLSDDGYVDPLLFTTAAAPVSGPPIGIDNLAAHIRDRLDAKTVSMGKLLSDAGELVESVGTAAGVWQGYTIDFDNRWSKVRDAAAAGLVPGAGAAALEDALCRIEDFVAAVSVETGGPFGEMMRSDFGGVRVAEDVTEAAGAAAPEAPVPSRQRRRPVDLSPVRQAVGERLDARIGDPLREVLWQRAVFGGSVAYAGVGISQVIDRLTR